MKGLPSAERQRLGALLEGTSQAEVMGMIPQFSQVEIHSPAQAPFSRNKPGWTYVNTLDTKS